MHNILFVKIGFLTYFVLFKSNIGSMKEIVIREARAADLQILLEYEQKLISAERPFDPTIRQAPVSYYDLEGLIKSEEARVVVAEADGQIVSTGYGIPKPARTYLDHREYAYLGFMFTHPEHRGKGINALIIDDLTSWAKGKGLDEVRLTVYEDNIPAISAYEKVGFKKHIIEMRLSLSKDGAKAI
jgi:ribosomal protein S18 acetylase RimI-like enzyme